MFVHIQWKILNIPLLKCMIQNKPKRWLNEIKRDFNAGISITNVAVVNVIVAATEVWFCQPSLGAIGALCSERRIGVLKRENNNALSTATGNLTNVARTWPEWGFHWRCLSVVVARLGRVQNSNVALASSAANKAVGCNWPENRTLQSQVDKSGERSHHHHHGHHCRAQKLVRVDLASLYSSCGSMSQAQQSGPDFRCLTTFRLSPGHFFPLETRRGPPHPSSPNLCPQSLGCQMAIWQAVNAKGIGQGMGDTINGSGWFTKQMFWSIQN